MHYTKHGTSEVCMQHYQLQQMSTWKLGHIETNFFQEKRQKY